MSTIEVNKVTPVSGGTNLQIGESGDTTNLSAGTVTLPTSIITGQTEKTTLVDADKFLISDSAASGAFKYVQKSNLPSGTFVQTGRTVISGGNPASVNVNSCFSSTYDTYFIVLDKIEATVDSATIFCRLRNDSGSVTSSNYRFSNRYFDDGGNTQSHVAAASSRYEITNNSDDASNTGFLQGHMYIHRPHSSGEYTRMILTNSFYNSTLSDIKVGIGTCAYENPETHTGIEFEITSGGLRDGGSFTVYGIAYS